MIPGPSLRVPRLHTRCTLKSCWTVASHFSSRLSYISVYLTMDIVLVASTNAIEDGEIPATRECGQTVSHTTT